MSNEEFSKLNPIIMGLKAEYSTQKDAYLVQGQFFQTHMFIFDTLDDRMVDVLKLRFGLVDGKCWTLQAIGDKYGLTRERIRTIEASALVKLRHPHRIKLMKQYTDQTFDKDNNISFINDFKSLIRQDILDNITLESMQCIEDVKISELDIKKAGNHKQRDEDIKTILIQNGIISGKDLILYLKEGGDINKLGITDSSYQALLCAICDLIDSGNAKITSQQMINDYIEHKRECEQQAQLERLKYIAEEERISQQNRAECLKNASKNPENVPIEYLNLDSKTYATFIDKQITTVADIIKHYNDNSRRFKHNCYLNERREREVLKKLKSLGITLSPQYEKPIKPLNEILIEDFELGLRAYNALKRTKINTLDDLINFYIDNNASFSKIRNLGIKCEEEILNKLDELGINLNLTCFSA